MCDASSIDFIFEFLEGAIVPLAKWLSLQGVGVRGILHYFVHLLFNGPPPTLLTQGPQAQNDGAKTKNIFTFWIFFNSTFQNFNLNERIVFAIKHHKFYSKDDAKKKKYHCKSALCSIGEFNWQIALFIRSHI